MLKTLRGEDFSPGRSVSFGSICVAVPCCEILRSAEADARIGTTVSLIRAFHARIATRRVRSIDPAIAMRRLRLQVRAMDRKIMIGRRYVALCAIWVVTLIGCTRSIPSVADAVKLAGEEVAGRVKVTGYCRPDHLNDWLFEKPGAQRWEGAKIALDVGSMFGGDSAEERRERRIRRLLELEGKRVEIVGTLKPGTLDLAGRHTGLISVEEIRVVEQRSAVSGPVLNLPVVCPYGHSTFQHVRIIWGRPLRAPDALAVEALKRHEIM